MLRSYRDKLPQIGLIGAGIVALLMCGMLVRWASLENAKYERQAHDRTAHYSKHTYNQQRDTCVRLSAPDRPNCQREAEEAKRSYEHDQEDLLAQRTAALWAYVMGMAAVIGMGLSALGVLLVWTTFRETRRTADEARHANEIAHDTARRELRAYVNVTNTLIRFLGAGETPELHLGYINSGNTPARDVQIISKGFVFRNRDQRKPVQFERLILHSKIVLAAHAPSIHSNKFSRALTEDEAKSISDGDWTVIYAGILSYKDVFGKRHRTIFKAQYDPGGVSLPDGWCPLIACSEGNRST